MFSKKRKIFCIGYNKTGTTTFERIMKDHGYKMGDQPTAELLFDHYANRNFKPIIKYCKTAQVFQDIPFSLPFSYIPLHQAFPKAKFILTVRDNEEVWYNSLIRFLRKRFKTEHDPTAEMLKAHNYRRKGYMYSTGKFLYQNPDSDFFNKDSLIELYKRHNKNARDYFRDSENFTVINFSKSGDFQKLCNFIGFEPKYNEAPWENKSAE